MCVCVCVCVCVCSAKHLKSEFCNICNNFCKIFVTFSKQTVSKRQINSKIFPTTLKLLKFV